MSYTDPNTELTWEASSSVVELKQVLDFRRDSISGDYANLPRDEHWLPFIAWANTRIRSLEVKVGRLERENRLMQFAIFGLVGAIVGLAIKVMP
ncbi:hypothetical protein [Elioraea sp.]|uniref:hypothetical protein n=1 Tax=Elioraea sp. TaxID=2185103 RepID=UPI003F6F9556